MSRLLTPAQKAANTLKRADEALRNWQEEPDRPHADVNDMLRDIARMRALVQAHIEAELERGRPPHSPPPTIPEKPESYDIPPRPQDKRKKEEASEEENS